MWLLLLAATATVSARPLSFEEWQSQHAIEFGSDAVGGLESDDELRVHEYCNLNGHLEKQLCQCLPAWRGATCGELVLLPVVRGAGMHANADLSSWGGSVAWDPDTSRWQGFFNELVSGCGINSWESNSRIVRASTDDLDKPFKIEAVIKPAFGSEPTLTRMGDQWLLYSIGNQSSTLPPRTDCREGYTPKAHPPKGTGGNFHGFVPVEIRSSDNLTSDSWTLESTIGNGDFNPAGYVFPNGSTILMWRHLARTHMVSATDFRGPFAFNGSDQSCLINHAYPDDPGCRWWRFLGTAADSRGIEDPVIFVQPDSLSSDSDSTDHVTFHALFHDHKSYGGHAFSRDGATWTFSDTAPFGNVVNFTDGTSIELQRRERPHVILNERGFMTHLLSAVQPPPTAAKHPPTATKMEFQNDFTFTMIQPVQTN